MLKSLRITIFMLFTQPNNLFGTSSQRNPCFYEVNIEFKKTTQNLYTMFIRLYIIYVIH